MKKAKSKSLAGYVLCFVFIIALAVERTLAVVAHFSDIGGWLWMFRIPPFALLLAVAVSVPVAASKLYRPHISRGRTVASSIYLLALFACIPLYSATPVGIVVSLLLVACFLRVLDSFVAGGGQVRFGWLWLSVFALGSLAVYMTILTEAAYYRFIFPTAIAAFVCLVGGVYFGNIPLLSFYGFRRTRSYFEGWYIKLQCESETIAFIPSYHIADGQHFAMLQIITTAHSSSYRFDSERFDAATDRFYVKLAASTFSFDGIDVHTPDGRISGSVTFGVPKQIHGDIMGPFGAFPLMQCKHGVLSMRHKLCGSLIIDGVRHDFSGGLGYIEKDFGSSFPLGYAWTQATSPDTSVMLSVATIRYLFLRFRGMICEVEHKGRHYRLATYNFARISELTSERIVARRGGYSLEITPQTLSPQLLAAPVKGNMSRTIGESPASTVRYVFRRGKKIIFDMTSTAAGFEFVPVGVKT